MRHVPADSLQHCCRYCLAIWVVVALSEPGMADVMNDVAIGIELRGGPPQISGWKNAYNAHELGGWPPPERLAALMVMSRVAVALIENVPEEFKKDVHYYRKVHQSELPEGSQYLMRGAIYEYEKPQ